MSQTQDPTTIDMNPATTTPLACLRSDEQIAPWLDYLEEIGAPASPVALPYDDDLRAALRDLDVPVDDVESLVTMRSTIAENGDLQWLLDRCINSLVLNMDVVAAPPRYPVLPPELGPIAPFFYVYVYAAMVPLTRQIHRQHAISDDMSRAIFADVGRNMLVHRKRHGTHGLAAPDWLMLHFRGMIFQLGRLQFERARIGNRTGTAIQAAGLPYATGDPALSIHITDFSGPMSVEACDDSFAQARAFFPKHFPDEDVHIAVCNSWLLDPQLTDYLSPESNTIRFQHRFQEIRSSEWSDDGPIRFVFGPTDTPLDELPQQTSVQRAIVNHLKAGKHWHGGMGWLVLS